MLRLMKTTLLLSLALVAPLYAQEPNPQGDYANLTPEWDRYWMVTAKEGLDLRRVPEGVRDLSRAPVYVHLPAGTVLTDEVTTTDKTGKSWFRTSVPAITFYSSVRPQVPKDARLGSARPGSMYLQAPYGTGFFSWRANRKYLKPVARPLPIPDPKGNYSDDVHQTWKVVDRGLTGRMHPGYLEALRNDRAIPKKITQWPVVAHFAYGANLRTDYGNRGNIMLTDEQGGTWYRVSDGKQTAFVRANPRFIAPR